jgi:hypothetical protein
MTKMLTRKELYDLVWARPVTKIAADFQISDVALHKICRKHKVPTPKAGHWAKVAAGKPVRTTALPKINDPALDRIQIRGGQRHSAAMRAAAKHSRERSALEKHTDSTDEAPGRQTSLYIEKIKKKLLSSKARRDGFIRISGKRQFTIAITPASIERTITFLEGIWNEMQDRGYDLGPSDEGLAFRIDSEAVGFTLTEVLEREPHDPTESEQSRLKRWEDSCRRKRRRGEYVSTWDKPEIPEYDYVPRGRLVFEFIRKIHYRGLRYRYADGKRQRIENLVDRVVTAAAVNAVAIKEKREERERWKREWEEQERQRRELERQRRLEAKRWEFLENRMKKLNVAIDLEKFVKDYTCNFPFEDLPTSCQQLLQWARTTAEEIRAAIAPDRLASVLDQHQLMDDRTDIDSWVSVVD